MRLVYLKLVRLLVSRMLDLFSFFKVKHLEKQADIFEKNPALQERLEIIEEWCDELDEKLDLIMAQLRIDVEGEE